MKIDTNATLTSQMPTERAAKPVSTGSPAIFQSKTEDRTTFSNSGKTTVQSLTSQALQTPEIRQDKVTALKESIKNGSYNLDPSKIASAMIADNE
jgi:negative regulator of flagellin synthesis FlgM